MSNYLNNPVFLNIANIAEAANRKCITTGYRSYNFHKPDKNIGYGAIIHTLANNPNPIPRQKVQMMLGKVPTSNTTTYARLAHSGLLVRSSKGFYLSELGRVYYNLWQKAN